MARLRGVLSGLVALKLALASPFDPHSPAAPGAFGDVFFDGWYMRIVDHKGDLAVACIFAGFKPKHSGAYNSSFATLLYRPPGTNATLTEQFLLDQSGVQITSRSEDTPGSRSSFVWSSSQLGTFEIDGDTGSVDFRFSLLNLSARFSRRVPWDPTQPDTAGPEGWAGRVLPVPCHYFVHTLASRATYNITLPGGKSLSGDGFTHMETNYGKIFPRGWVWAEAIDATGGSQLVLTGGEFISGLPIAQVSVVAYRSSALSWSFSSTNLDLVTKAFNASAGHLRVVARQLLTGRELQVDLSADPASFSEPLFCPTEAGFVDKPGAVESFSATASVTARVRGQLVEERVFTLAALEFGADFRKAVRQAQEPNTLVV